MKLGAAEAELTSASFRLTNIINFTSISVSCINSQRTVYQYPPDRPFRVVFIEFSPFQKSRYQAQNDNPK